MAATELAYLFMTATSSCNALDIDHALMAGRNEHQDRAGIIAWFGAAWTCNARLSRLRIERNSSSTLTILDGRGGCQGSDAEPRLAIAGASIGIQRARVTC